MPAMARLALSSAAPGDDDGCFLSGCRLSTFQPPVGERRGEAGARRVRSAWRSSRTPSRDQLCKYAQASSDCSRKESLRVRLLKQ